MFISMGGALAMFAAYAIIHFEVWKFWEDEHGFINGLICLFIFPAIGGVGALCAIWALKEGIWFFIIPQGAAAVLIAVLWRQNAVSESAKKRLDGSEDQAGPSN